MKTKNRVLSLNFSENFFGNDLNGTLYVRILKKPVYGSLYYFKKKIKKCEKTVDNLEFWTKHEIFILLIANMKMKTVL